MTDHLPGAAKVAAFYSEGDRRDLRLDACRGLALWFVFIVVSGNQEVHFPDDDRPPGQDSRAALLPTLKHRLSYCCAATVAGDSEPTRLPISGAGVSGT
jgi:hypothetical protein